MKTSLFLTISEKEKTDFYYERKIKNYKFILILGFSCVIIQIFNIILQLYKPFSLDKTIMKYYYNFYYIIITTTIILLLLTIYTKKVLDNKSKMLSFFMCLDTFIILFWGMGVAVADQFQNEDVVVYFLLLFILSIFLNISLFEFGFLVFITEAIFIVIINIIKKNINHPEELIISSIQFIGFTTFIRYFINELNKREFIYRKKLEFLSYYDSLSCVYNRRKWEEIYASMVTKSIEGNRSLAVILLDIDYFKNYNDNYGHLQGDIAIKKISSILDKLSNLSNGNLGRYGGDEFIISILDISEIKLQELTNNIKQEIINLNIENKISGIDNILTVSIGYSIGFLKNPVDVQYLINAADKSLYLDKKNKSF